VADCEQDKVTRMKFGGTVEAANGRYVREDKFAILTRSNEVEAGMSRKKVTKLLGQPSFVEGNTTDEGQFANCEWHYVFAGRKEDTGYFTEQQALIIAFDELGKVKSKSERKQY
jgi:outer membrane protein assembly factor BamE (lipoprotein component of BamABCDE complex)